MVVAGVFLIMIYAEFSILLPLVAVVMISLYLSGWYDGKKMVALSTSVHLVVIMICRAVGLYGIVVFHIVTHGFVKASAFVNSGWYIHIDGRQDLRV
jgi:NADH:ubiquinone oxidoreductase subunit 5 (subunit L)/multisubunit Na+/H+ antiporter MnhA subunit